MSANIPVSERPATSDLSGLRADFPALHQEINGHPLTYLDSAATSQKPASVIAAVADFYRNDNANVHRGVHELSERATRSYESTRDSLQRFVGARSRREIIFTRGTTDAINLVAQSFVRPKAKPGDEIVITGLEHHSNIVPWQLVCEQTGARLRVAGLDERGDVPVAAIESLLNDKTRILAISHVSNALGTINPVAEMIAAARQKNIPVLLDGAQALPHMAVNVQALDCDFYALSAHKMFGPTGIGALYGREELLEAMPPYQGGGDMISMVSFEETWYNELPYKFEAGTPNIAGVIGFGRAIEYLDAIGMSAISAYEDTLLRYALDELANVPGLRFIGRPRHRAGVVSFVLDGLHPHDLGTIVNAEGVAIRTGHHCAMPVMTHFQVPATARASLALYNNREDIDRLTDALVRAREILT